MQSFEQLYCERNGCDVRRFRRQLFLAILPWQARLAIPLVGGCRGRYFAPDQNLIAAVGEAKALRCVTEEIRDFFMDPENSRWIRRVARVRVSTTRLREIARLYLPAE
jgi:hypothetical protein